MVDPADTRSPSPHKSKSLVSLWAVGDLSEGPVLATATAYLPAQPGGDRCEVVIPDGENLSRITIVTDIYQAGVVHAAEFEEMIPRDGERLAVFRLR